MSRDKTCRKHLFLLPPRGGHGRLGGRGGQSRQEREYDTRRSPLGLAVIVKSSRHILVFGGSKWIQTMMHIRISSEAPKQRRPKLSPGTKSHGTTRANRYLGSFLANRRLQAPARQNLRFRFLLLHALFLPLLMPLTSTGSLRAPNPCSHNARAR